MATLLEVILILEASLFSIRTLVPLTSSSFGVEASWSHPRQNLDPSRAPAISHAFFVGAGEVGIAPRLCNEGGPARI